MRTELNIRKSGMYRASSSRRYDREVLLVLRRTIEVKSDKNFKKLYLSFKLTFRSIIEK